MYASHVYILAHSDAQLTPPGEAVCVGEEVVFVCQQNGSTSLFNLVLTWIVDLPGGTSIERSVFAPKVGTVWTFENDPGFGFEIRILSSSSAGKMSQLHVTAARELNGVTVECLGGGGRFTSTIHVALVGE